MIEFINEETCTNCNKCVQVCPTDVFERTAGATPEIARQHDCTSCMNCELYCPHDSIYVSPVRWPEENLDRREIIASGVLGSYARAMGWRNGEAPNGTRDNIGVYAMRRRERQGAGSPPDPSDRDYAIRKRLYDMRDRNLIPIENQ
jgi:NAD-dependent dihydropyrimidine dehydrogenase PreA subunit